MAGEKFTLVFNERMTKLMAEDNLDRRERLKAELADLDSAINRMDEVQEESKDFKKNEVKRIETIIELVEAMNDGIQFKGKELRKIIKKIIKNDKDCKKIFKKFRDKNFLEDDLKSWDKSDIMKLIEKMAASKLDTATGISMSLAQDKASGKIKNKDEEKKGGMGTYKASKKRKTTAEMKEEEAIAKDIKNEFAVSVKICKSTIQDVDETITSLDEIIDDLKGNKRASNRNRDLSTLIGVKKDLLKTRLDASDKIVGINKTILDASYKRIKDKNKGKQDESNLSDAEIFTNFFTNSLSGKIDKSDKKNSGKDKNNKRGRDLDRAVSARNIELNDYDSAIKYEGKWEPIVKSTYDESKWKFEAIGPDGNIIRGFPKSMLPNKKMVDLVFIDDEHARDKKTGQPFKVIKVMVLK